MVIAITIKIEGIERSGVDDESEKKFESLITKETHSIPLTDND